MLRKNVVSRSFYTIVFSALSFGCFAESYGGVSILAIDYEETGFSEEAELTAVYGRMGGFFNENFSGEVRVGAGIGDDTIYGADLSLESMFGAYLRGGVQAGVFYPYVIIGYTRGELEASIPGYSISDSESDTSFGFGVDISFGEKIKGNVEYMDYLDKDGVEIGGFSVGLVTLF